MLVVLLVLAIAGTAWSIWLEWKERTPNCEHPPAEKPEPTPVVVEWDERVDGVEDKKKMQDRIFEQHRHNDDDVDPPTVVADRR